MKLKTLILALLIFTAIFQITVPFSQEVCAIEKPHYLALRPGLYFFTDDMEEKTFIQTGFSGEAAYGYYFHPNFGLELNTGYFHDGVKGHDVRGCPTMIIAKGYYSPIKLVELYAGVGGGAVYAEFEGDTKFGRVDDDDTVVGGNVVFGTNFNVLSNFFVGMQGRYIFTDKVDFNQFSANLNGFTSTINLGFRF